MRACERLATWVVKLLKKLFTRNVYPSCSNYGTQYFFQLQTQNTRLDIRFTWRTSRCVYMYLEIKCPCTSMFPGYFEFPLLRITVAWKFRFLLAKFSFLKALDVSEISMEISTKFRENKNEIRRISFALLLRNTYTVVKGAKSRFVHLEKFSLNFSSSSFVVRVNLHHP